MGPVAGMEIGAPFFLGQPVKNGWESPTKLGITSASVELFCDEPDALSARALEPGAKGSLDTLENSPEAVGYPSARSVYGPVWAYRVGGDKPPLRQFQQT
jgi:hypothetical protein